MEHIPFEQLNGIDLVDFLASIGIQPTKSKTCHYFYCSPLDGHPAYRATFVVNRRVNRWHETTTKEYGNLVDLAVRLYHCTIHELTTILRSSLPPTPNNGSVEGPEKAPRITVEQVHPIRSACLERYLWTRRIPLNVARIYLLEAWYRRDKDLYHALVFPNNVGGFELFDRNHLYRVPPYRPTLIGDQRTTIAIFRHVFDLLSFAAISASPVQQFPDFLILHAPVAFPAVQPIMASYRDKHLFLPNDAAGIAFCNQATHNLQNCHDHRFLYNGYPTLNDWICRIGTAPSPKISSIGNRWAQLSSNTPNCPKSPQNALTPERQQVD